MTQQTKIVVIFGSIVAALLVAVLVVGVVLVNTMNAQADEAAYQACMARHGFAVDERTPAVSEDDLDAYTDAIVTAAEACMPD